jgi:hypothetical protein
LSGFGFEQRKTLLARGKKRAGLIIGQENSSLINTADFFSTIWSNIADFLHTSPIDLCE